MAGPLSVLVYVCSHERNVDLSEIIPELWMLSKYGHHLIGAYSEKTDHELTVVSKKE